MGLKRIFVEKRPGYDVEAQGLFRDLAENLGLAGLQRVRIVNRYDIEGISDEEYRRARGTVFAEPPVDLVYDEELPIPSGDRVLAMEYIPGQYDQRSDSAAQCLQIITQGERPSLASAKIIVLSGKLSDRDFARVKDYCLNPVEAREASPEKPVSLEFRAPSPPNVEILNGFRRKNPEELEQFRLSAGLAMSAADLAFCQEYFRATEKRDPSLTEIRVIDTYWSDHCRHTTFQTRITAVAFAPGESSRPLRLAYDEYLAARRSLYAGEAEKRDICLMDIATAGMKELKKKGLLQDLDESPEINACSIIVDAKVDGRTEEWLVMFKNETHNHPTEIEPFGGAATCLGGAIRDPLSGRTYVYQAMRFSGSGDPRRPLGETLPGKLPQRKITTGAAAGYSSYGNQIGLATGQVAEVYDEGFMAKRMEIGAVIGAAPRHHVVRAQPLPGDVVLLVGGRTGRDGCGGATGSSKEHTAESLLTCGAEVQKGNPPTERKLQRLFRRREVSTLIKRCNDFGAGGVSVAMGELADGLDIDLDAIPKKYEGLDGTELAISESQERMAVVVAREDAARFVIYAREENLEATPVGRVTDRNRLCLTWRNRPIVDISRAFLDTNGVRPSINVKVKAPDPARDFFASVVPDEALLSRSYPQSEAKEQAVREAWLTNLRDLNVCSQKGLVERFDSSIGASTVLMPFGGRHQATPSQGMAAKLPVLDGETETTTLMTYGYQPRLAHWSPFHAAVYAIVEAVTKIAALGGDPRKVRLTLQEYFEKLGRDPEKWGKPFSALLGAYYAQKRLGIPAIGGKDSMSGTFLDLNVPPTLVAFAVCVTEAPLVISQELKEGGSQLVLLPLRRDAQDLPDFEGLRQNFAKVRQLAEGGCVLAVQAVSWGGQAAALTKMAFGNRLGIRLIDRPDVRTLFTPELGSLILELRADVDPAQKFGEMDYQVLGTTLDRPVLVVNGTEIALEEAWEAWSSPLEKVFPTQTAPTAPPRAIHYPSRNSRRPLTKLAAPRVLIPVFPGTNCEYDSARAFARAGAVTETLVIRNLTPREVEESIEILAGSIRKSQIVMLAGGFSAGDEPDGSGKFIAAMFRNPRVEEAVEDLMRRRDGLMLGICNGFQALIKLGLVPYGEIRDLQEDSPTLTYNRIGRHISCMAQTKVVSVLSPWFSQVEPGDVHTVALSHGEGRFVASPEVIQSLVEKGQIATQYVDLAGNPSHDVRYTPNGSYEAVEGITSPDGRILGKMGHSERSGAFVAKNVPGNKYQPLFAGGVEYFR
ncbi:phosphoribosylformylglycinamidine synthase [Acididesulfobacillus acetoxydans]|nr:phosphoribosylformylglycinamidine synthase [Acididesulfobacillus acetoxydans]